MNFYILVKFICHTQTLNIYHTHQNISNKEKCVSLMSVVTDVIIFFPTSFLQTNVSIYVTFVTTVDKQLNLIMSNVTVSRGLYDSLYI
jgi:hypothetical protein